MADQITTFNVEMQAYLTDAKDRLAALNTRAASSVAHASEEMKRQMTLLETKAAEAKTHVEVAYTELQKWAADPVATVNDWIVKHEVTKLTARADRAEDYATAASQVALASARAAEKAGLSARLARADATAAAKAA